MRNNQQPGCLHKLATQLSGRAHFVRNHISIFYCQIISITWNIIVRGSRNYIWKKKKKSFPGCLLFLCEISDEPHGTDMHFGFFKTRIFLYSKAAHWMSSVLYTLYSEVNEDKQPKTFQSFKYNNMATKKKGNRIVTMQVKGWENTGKTDTCLASTWPFYIVKSIFGFFAFPQGFKSFSFLNE